MKYEAWAAADTAGRGAALECREGPCGGAERAGGGTAAPGRCPSERVRPWPGARGRHCDPSGATGAGARASADRGCSRRGEHPHLVEELLRVERLVHEAVDARRGRESVVGALLARKMRRQSLVR